MPRSCALGSGGRRTGLSSSQARHGHCDTKWGSCLRASNSNVGLVLLQEAATCPKHAFRVVCNASSAWPIVLGRSSTLQRSVSRHTADCTFVNTSAAPSSVDTRGLTHEALHLLGDSLTRPCDLQPGPRPSQLPSTQRQARSARVDDMEPASSPGGTSAGPAEPPAVAGAQIRICGGLGAGRRAGGPPLPPARRPGAGRGGASDPRTPALPLRQPRAGRSVPELGCRASPPQRQRQRPAADRAVAPAADAAGSAAAGSASTPTCPRPLPPPPPGARRRAPPVRGTGAGH